MHLLVSPSDTLKSAAAGPGPHQRLAEKRAQQGRDPGGAALRSLRAAARPRPGQQHAAQGPVVQHSPGRNPGEAVRRALAGVLSSVIVATAPVAAAPAAEWSPDLAVESLAQASGAVSKLFVDRGRLEELHWDARYWDLAEQTLRSAGKEDSLRILRGMLEALGDPFTRVEETQRFTSDSTGQMVHVGFFSQAHAPGGPHVVSRVMEGSAAQRAGIRVGDVITHANGVPVAALRPETFRALLLGRVEVGVARGPEPPQTITLVASAVEMFPVKFGILRRGGDWPALGWVGIQTFGANTARDTAAALRHLLRQGVAGLILDLRGNSGGLVTAGVAVSEMLLEPGSVLGYVSTVASAEKPYLLAAHPITHRPLAVLVNGWTASTSELLAGALQGNERAHLIGERTFGKGRTQKVFRLADDSTLLVSSALITTPKHARIDKVGLTPDLACKNTTPQPPAFSADGAAGLSAALAADACVSAAATHLLLHS